MPQAPGVPGGLQPPGLMIQRLPAGVGLFGRQVRPQPGHPIPARDHRHRPFPPGGLRAAGGGLRVQVDHDPGGRLGGLGPTHAGQQGRQLDVGLFAEPGRQHPGLREHGAEVPRRDRPGLQSGQQGRVIMDQVGAEPPQVAGRVDAGDPGQSKLDHTVLDRLRDHLTAVLRRCCGR